MTKTDKAKIKAMRKAEIYTLKYMYNALHKNYNIKCNKQAHSTGYSYFIEKDPNFIDKYSSVFNSSILPFGIFNLILNKDKIGIKMKNYVSFDDVKTMYKLFYL